MGELTALPKPPSWILGGPTSKGKGEAKRRGMEKEGRGKEGRKRKGRKKGEGEGRKKEDEAPNWDFWLRHCMKCSFTF